MIKYKNNNWIYLESSKNKLRLLQYFKDEDYMINKLQLNLEISTYQIRKFLFGYLFNFKFVVKWVDLKFSKFNISKFENSNLFV
jgi:hypothetical protein